MRARAAAITLRPIRRAGRETQDTEAVEATFRAVFENAQDGIVIVDDDGRFLDANPAVEHVLGATREQLTGHLAEEFVPPAEHDMLEGIRRRLREHRAVRGHYAFELPGGEQRWVEYTANAHFLPGRHLAVIRDCTVQHRNQQALERRAAQQVAIAELSLMALGRASPGELMRAVVSRIAETLEVEHVAILEGPADSGEQLLHASVGWQAGERACEAAQSRTAVAVPCHDSVWGRLEVRSSRKRDFTHHDVDFLRSVANTLGLALGAAADDEELHRRSAEITRLASARQRIVAQALAAEDRARERISQQLHDELLQSLFVIRQDLAVIANDPRRSDLVVRARDGVYEAIQSLRAALFDIHPVVLDRSGLRSAVGAVAQHHARLGGFAIDVDVAPEAEGEHARLLLSLVRELLANVARHAGAEHAEVRLWREGDEVVLEVRDDGRGIEPAEASSALSHGHIGLASAAQRVEALSGRLDVTARPGGGTNARAVIPLSRSVD